MTVRSRAQSGLAGRRRRSGSRSMSGIVSGSMGPRRTAVGLACFPRRRTRRPGRRPRVSSLLLLTNALQSSAEMLPALGLLPHQVRILPAEPTVLVEAPDCDAVLVDGRHDLASVRSLCRLIRTTGVDVPVLADRDRGRAHRRRRRLGRRRRPADHRRSGRGRGPAAADRRAGSRWPATTRTPEARSSAAATSRSTRRPTPPSSTGAAST